MLPIDITVRFQGPLAGSVSMRKRTWKKIQTSGWKKVGQYWHRTIRPKHFTPGGAAEYGYTTRNRSYTASKLERHGHTNPLELSGQAKRDSAREDVRAKFDRVDVVIHAPVLNFRGADSDVNMSDEIRTISEKEKRILAKVFEKFFVRTLKTIRNKQVEFFK